MFFRQEEGMRCNIPTNFVSVKPAENVSLSPDRLEAGNGLVPFLLVPLVHE